jgi:uridine kinase
MKSIKIKCLNNNLTKEFKRGTTLAEIAESFSIKLKNPILGAMVNNRLAELSYEVFHPKNVEFIDITHPDGMRMYVRSLTFVLYKAIGEVIPEARLRVEHSISKGIFCKLCDIDKEPTIQDIFNIGRRMRDIIEADLPFVHKEKETKKVVTILEEHGLYDKAKLVKDRGQVYSSYYKLDGHVDMFYGYLVPSTGYLNVFDLNKYYNGMLLQLPKQDKPNEVAELIIQDKMFEIFREFAEWNRVLKITNLSDLNALARNGKAETLIKVSEALHEKKIAQIADKISSKKDDVKLVLISGPSSSGKTTFSKRLAVQLLVAGIKPLTLSLDNYFVDREKTPKDENGEYDFEALEALDIEKFNEDLKNLFAGNEVEIPKFSFEKGKRYYDGEKLKMDENNILVVEGIHGLNPKLTHLIPPKEKFKIYVSALTSINIDDHNRIPTTDNRLVRRLVRDYKYRKYSADDTIARWPSVRRGEEKHIFPFQEEADVMFNTALLYELAVLKPLAEHILHEVRPDSPQYAEATRLLNFFSYFKTIDSKEIPPTSIVREFLGGSSFNY